MNATRDIARPMPRSGTHVPRWTLRAVNSQGVLAAKPGLTGLSVRYATAKEFSASEAAEPAWIAGMPTVTLGPLAQAPEIYVGQDGLTEAQKAPLEELVDAEHPEPEFYEILLVGTTLRAYQKYKLVDE